MQKKSALHAYSFILFFRKRKRSQSAALAVPAAVNHALYKNQPFLLLSIAHFNRPIKRPIIQIADIRRLPKQCSCKFTPF